mmetsp:Transcript_5782/g.10626  ORF Transcript_5782/g.10626 Transcript_5782/m.10626 type:complete len:80 (+) Transcript_5782:384-623(+)
MSSQTSALSVSQSASTCANSPKRSSSIDYKRYESEDSLRAVASPRRGVAGVGHPPRSLTPVPRASRERRRKPVMPFKEL